MHHHTKTVLAVVAGIAVVALFFWYGLPGVTVPGVASQASVGQLAQSKLKLANITVQENSFNEIAPGLKIADVLVGDGGEAVAGTTVVLHYVGTFADGREFDSSLTRGQPLAFVLGQHQVISGFEQGLTGMRVGGVRRIVVPPDLGYGATGITAQDGTVIIPGNSTLIFDVELVSVNNP